MTDAEYEQHKRLQPEEALTRQTPADRARERREAAAVAPLKRALAEHDAERAGS